MQISSASPPSSASAAGGRRVSFAAEDGDSDAGRYPPGETAPSADESCMQPLCEVVAIVSRALSRKLVVGIIVPPPSSSHPLLLRPLDSRLPSFVIDAAALPGLSHYHCISVIAERSFFRPGLLSSSSCAMQSALISATFTDWSHLEQRPRAQLQAALGEAGAIASETAAILAMHGVGSPEFSKEVIDCLPEHPYRVPESEIKARKDCRLEATNA
jgi:exoribonuclease R